MQDKDMDALFRSKLENFEAEPSAGVWGNISHGLHGTAGRRKSPVALLRIAASVVVLIAAGLFFLINGKKPASVKPDHKMARVQPGKRQVNRQIAITVAPAIAVTKQPTAPGASQQKVAVVHRHKASVQLPAPSVNAIKPTAGTATVEEALVAPDQQVLAATVVAAVSPDNRAVVPDTQIRPALKDTAPEFITKPATILAANTSGSTNKPDVAKKHKPHGLGGVLNAMIGTVDKRADKIIEFTDTDEGDSVTGINLGIIKIKKQ